MSRSSRRTRLIRLQRMPLAETKGTVSRDSVIAVLKSVLPSPGTSISIEGTAVTLSKDGISELIVLPQLVARPLLHTFAHKYGVRIELFYHPEMCQKLV